MTFSELDLSKVYTYADYFNWYFPERVELLQGRVHKMRSSPGPSHQQTLLSIATKLHFFLGSKHVYIAPFDVRFPDKCNNDSDVINVVQPDVCVVCDDAKLDSRGCLGAPDIVVEILSPGNNTVELRNKYELYQQSGVTEYWIVSPQDRTFLIYTLISGAYVPSRLMTSGDVITSSVLPGFSLDLTTLFSAID